MNAQHPESAPRPRATRSPLMRGVAEAIVFAVGVSLAMLVTWGLEALGDHTARWVTYVGVVVLGALAVGSMRWWGERRAQRRRKGRS